MYGALAIFLVLSLAGLIAADLTDHWSSADNKRIVKQLQSTISSRDSSNKQIYYSLQLLREAGAANSCECSALTGRLSGVISEAFYGFQSLESCGCPHEVDSSTLEAIKSGLSVSATLLLLMGRHVLIVSFVFCSRTISQRLSPPSASPTSSRSFLMKCLMLY